MSSVIPAAIALLGLAANAQIRPQPADILQRVSETYASVTEWDVGGISVSTISQPGKKVTLATRQRSAGKGSSKRRIETENQTTGDLYVSIIDGENYWEYSGRDNRFAKAPLSDAAAEVELMLRGSILFPQDMQARATGIQLLREESLPMNGTAFECYVIQFKGPRVDESHTWWIDKARFVILRDDQHGPDLSVESSTQWVTLRLNEPVPDAMFAFTPPAGARQIERAGR